jgi:hypothetical protein
MFAGHDTIPHGLPNVVSVTGAAWRIGHWLEPGKRHEPWGDVDHPLRPPALSPRRSPSHGPAIPDLAGRYEDCCFASTSMRWAILIPTPVPDRTLRKSRSFQGRSVDGGGDVSKTADADVDRCRNADSDLSRASKNLGVRPLGAPLRAANPDTSVGTPLRAPDSGFSPAFVTGDARHAWSIASAAVCRSAC